MATLRDLGSEPFESVPTGAWPVTAPDDRWVVLAGEAGPVSAIPPGAALAVGDRLPGVLVAAADMDLADALESDAFEQFADVTALILTEPGDERAGRLRVAGLVSGLTLARVMLRGPTRGVFGWGGSVLPGPPAIPLIARSCGYLEAGTTCATPISFRARPAVMPGCPNQRGLAAHQFDW
jgi:hypothetical protein